MRYFSTCKYSVKWRISEFKEDDNYENKTVESISYKIKSYFKELNKADHYNRNEYVDLLFKEVEEIGNISFKDLITKKEFLQENLEENVIITDYNKLMHLTQFYV